MAAAASKQGIILGRLWKALLLSRSKRLKENKKLMKRPKRAKKKERKKKEEITQGGSKKYVGYTMHEKL